MNQAPGWDKRRLCGHCASLAMRPQRYVAEYSHPWGKSDTFLQPVREAISVNSGRCLKVTVICVLTRTKGM